MPKTILLADDSVTIQKVVGISFANEDVVLMTVDNGDDAISRARESSPDIVLADIMMPGKNGYEVCEAIKSDAELRHVPVLLLSGTFESFDDDRARQVGADGHITKPFEAQALVDQVNELLERSAARANAGGPAPDAGEATVVATPQIAPEPSQSYDFFDDEIPPMQGGDAPVVESAAAEPAPPQAMPSADPVLEAPAATPPTEVETEAVPEAEDGETSIYDLEPLEDLSEAQAEAAPSDMSLNWDSTGGAALSERTALAFEDADLAPAGSLPEAPAATDREPEGVVGAPAAADLGAGPELETTALEGAPGWEASAPAAADDAIDPVIPPGESEADLFGDMPVGSEIYDAPDLLAEAEASAPAAPDEAIAAPDASPWQSGESAAETSAEAPSPRSMEDSWSPLGSPDPLGSSLGDSPVAEEPPSELPERPEAPPMAEPASPPPQPEPVAQEVPIEAGPSPAPSEAPLAGLSPDLEKRLHDTVEKLAWDALGDLSEQIVKEAINRVEAIAWEVIPQMAETLIREEIRRIKSED